MHPVINDAIVTIETTETAFAAAKKMERTQIGCLMVVDAKGMLTGMLTGRDLVLGVMSKGLDPARTLVADIMTARPTVLAMAGDLDVFKITKSMARARVRRLPVVDAANKPVGIVTLEDLLVKVAELLSNLGNVVAPYLTVARLQSARERYEQKH